MPTAFPISNGMDHNAPIRRLDFYENSPGGKTLRTLTLNDLTFWATDAFVAVILILYVLHFIEGGSASHFGLAFLTYKGVAALLSIPVGRYFDKHRGYVDEVWGLAIAGFIYGTCYMLLSFSTQLWQLYGLMFILGAASTINLLSWRTLFYNTIKKEEYTETVGNYQAIMFVGQGLALALGGIVGDTFGFDRVVFFGGLVIFLGGFLPLSIKYIFTKK